MLGFQKAVLMMIFGIRWDHLQVCYSGNIHNRNVFEVCVVRGGYGDGGPMGQQSCLYILSRARSGSAPPFTVSDLFSRHFCVSWTSIYPCLSHFYTILFRSSSYQHGNIWNWYLEMTCIILLSCTGWLATKPNLHLSLLLYSCFLLCAILPPTFFLPFLL